MRVRGAKKTGTQVKIKEFPDVVSVRESIKKGNAAVKQDRTGLSVSTSRYGSRQK